MRESSRKLALACLLTVAPLAAGCASTLPDGSPNPDPLEAVNRKVFWFNDRVDFYVLEPIAHCWDMIAPESAQSSIGNFFANLRWPISFVSNLLQGKLKAVGTETARFVVNSTVGVLGLFDPATKWGIDARREDLGEAFGKWGIPAGPYLVVPLFGPSSPRDGVGTLAEIPLSPLRYSKSPYAWYAAETVNWRTLNLEEIAKAKERSFDWYVFVRNAYTQNRASRVRDHDTAGLYDVPEQDEDDLYNTEDDDDDLYDLDFDDEDPT
jgi:phospholipid-binding lipoprotein MlaA